MKLSEIIRRKEGIVSILSGFLALVLLLGTCTAPGFLDTRGGYQDSAPTLDR